MANYSSIFPISSSASVSNNEIILFGTDTVLNQGGFYLTDSVVNDIKIDCSALPVGSEVCFRNTSNKNVVLYGFSSADNTPLPENKGVRISPSGFLWLTKNSTNNFNIRSGSYTQGWIPGFVAIYETPFISQPADHYGSSNIPRTPNDFDIFYKLGTLSIDGSTPVSWVNPVTRGKVIASASHNSANAIKCFSNNNYYNSWDAFPSQPNWIRFQFSDGAKIDVKRYGINTRNWNNSMPSWTLQGSNNGTDWTNIHSGTGLGTLFDRGDWYTSPAITAPDSYNYFRIYTTNSNVTIEEILLWGDYIE